MERVTTADNAQFKKKLSYCNKQWNEFAVNSTASMQIGLFCTIGQVFWITVKSRILTRPEHVSFITTPKMTIFLIEARLDYKLHILSAYISTYINAE